MEELARLALLEPALNPWKQCIRRTDQRLGVHAATGGAPNCFISLVVGTLRNSRSFRDVKIVYAYVGSSVQFATDHEAVSWLPTRSFRRKRQLDISGVHDSEKESTTT